MIRLTPDIPVEAREWRNDPRIWMWCRQNHLISEHDQETWLTKIANDPTIKMFGIYGDETEGGVVVPIGVCGLTSISLAHRSAEFSLYIAPGRQGAGYGNRALVALLKHGFWNLGLNRIWGDVFEGNQALEKFKTIGFKEEGILRQSYFKNGRFIDSTIISILRNEFDQLHRDNSN